MRRIQRGSQTKASLTGKESRLESIVLVKLIYYVRSTAPFLSKLCSNYARFNIILDNKMGKTVRKVSFINLLYYYYFSRDFVCCFSGFKYLISSGVSYFGSLQDQKLSSAASRVADAILSCSQRVGLGTRFFRHPAPVHPPQNTKKLKYYPN